MEIKATQEKRLVFIDIARSIAILMMLEGHFIVMALADKYRGNEYFLYEIWRFTRGFTAPLFFTVSGLVFTYLLVRRNKPFFQNERVRKGLKRGFQLIFWGYLLQVNLFYLFKGHFSGYLFVFHVLQCIGASLIIIIIFEGLQSLIRFIPLALWLGIVGFFGFILRPTIYAIDFSNVHPIIENILVVSKSDRAFKSIFALFPWVGFVAFGGMFGAFISKNPQRVYTNGFVIALAIIGFLLNVYPDNFLRLVQPYLLKLGLKPFVGLGYLFARLGQVFWAFGIIILIGIHKPFLKELFNTKLKFLKSWTLTILIALSGLAIIAYTLITNNQHYLLSNFTLYAFGNLLLFIAMIYTIAKVVNWNYDLFIKMGQKTLSIYIVHVIILYGGIFGFGMSAYLSRALGPWPSILGAIAFMALFAYFIKYFEFFDAYYQRLLFWKKKK